MRLLIEDTKLLWYRYHDSIISVIGVNVNTIISYLFFSPAISLKLCISVKTTRVHPSAPDKERAPRGLGNPSGTRSRSIDEPGPLLRMQK